MMAEQGILVATDSGPRVVMINGNRQEVERADGRLSLLYFDRYTFDLGQFTKTTENRWREPRERFLDELFMTGESEHDKFYEATLWAEGHQRLISPLYAIAFTLVGLAALLSGDFNRRGRCAGFWSRWRWWHWCSRRALGSRTSRASSRRPRR